jgi:hypothetical protein
MEVCTLMMAYPKREIASNYVGVFIPHIRGKMPHSTFETHPLNISSYTLLQRKAGRFYPTRLALDIASGRRKAASEMTRAGYIVVETNYRVYAYTENNLQVALLGLFTEMLLRFDLVFSLDLV